MLEIIIFIVVVGFGILLGALPIYWGTKITKENIPFLGAIVVSLGGGIVGIFNLPGVISFILSFVIMLLLLKKFSTVDQIWPDAVLILVVAMIINTIFQYAVLGVLK